MGKKYYDDNRQEICERVNKYRLNNIDIIREKKKEYCRLNKDKLSEQKRKKYTCEVCGKELTIAHRMRHERSKMHKDAL